MNEAAPSVRDHFILTGFLFPHLLFTATGLLDLTSDDIDPFHFRLHEIEIIETIGAGTYGEVSFHVISIYRLLA